jgi:hypothetical protein
VILHPGVIALVLSSIVIAALLVASSWHAVRVLRRWDLSSGSALQLDLERRTHLVSTIVSYALGFELVSLFLYVHTADALAPMFTGAMCAAGSLGASASGYPVLVLKLANFVLAGVWLVLNHADAQGFDYPLLRAKYVLLLALAVPVLAEAGLQIAYFLDLRPDVITSCCGSLFGREGRGLGADLAAFPHLPTAIAFIGTIGAALATGLLFHGTGRGGVAFAIASALALPVSIVAVVSLVSPYVYELPTHHCPFCLLQGEYGYVGYPLYATLLGGSVAGMGVGAVMPARRIESLAAAVPAMQRRLTAVGLTLLAIFTLIVAWQVNASVLRL